MTEHLRLINPSGPPEPGGLIETDTIREMLRTLRHAWAKQYACVGMIAGAPGVGKTQALFRFREEVPATVFITATAGEGGAWNLANALAERLDIARPNGRDLPGSRRRIAETIGAGGFVVIDEAQHLVQRNPRGPDNWEALEWARAMTEEGCFGLVFCGDLSLVDAVEKSPPLRRRIYAHRPQIISKVPKSDIAAFARARGVHDEATVELLFQVARRSGWFGIVSETLDHARRLSGGSAPTPRDILAAVEDLQLAPRGRTNNA